MSSEPGGGDGGVLAPPSGCYGPSLPSRAGGPRRTGPPPSEARFKSSPPSHLQRNQSVILRLHRAHLPVVGGSVSLTYQPTPVSPLHTNLPPLPSALERSPHMGAARLASLTSPKPPRASTEPE